MERFHLVLLVVAVVTTVAAAVLLLICRRRHDPAAPPSTLGELAGLSAGAAVVLWVLVPVFARWPALTGEPLTITFTVALIANLGLQFLVNRAQRRAKTRRRAASFRLALVWGVLLAVLAARIVAIFTID